MSRESDAVSIPNPVVAGEESVLAVLEVVSGHSVDIPRCCVETKPILLVAHFNHENLTKVLVTLHDHIVAVNYAILFEDLDNAQHAGNGNMPGAVLAAYQRQEDVGFINFTFSHLAGENVDTIVELPLCV